MLTCKQSNEVTTILGDLLWQASSNGLKYFSAEIVELPSLGSGKADEASVFSSAWHSDFMLSTVKTNYVRYIITLTLLQQLGIQQPPIVRCGMLGMYSLRAVSHSLRNSA